jgi:hypothetical protein
VVRSFEPVEHIEGVVPLFSAIHVPSWVYPLPVTQHLHLGDTTVLADALAAALELVRIVRVDHGWRLTFSFHRASA